MFLFSTTLLFSALQLNGLESPSHGADKDFFTFLFIHLCYNVTLIYCQNHEPVVFELITKYKHHYGNIIPLIFAPSGKGLYKSKKR